MLSRHSDALRAGRSGDRIPVGARFSVPVQTELRGPPSLLQNRYRVFPGAKRPRRGVDHPPPSSAEVKERVELYLYSPSGSSWLVQGWTLPLQKASFTHPENMVLLTPGPSSDARRVPDDLATSIRYDNVYDAHNPNWPQLE